MDDRPDVSAEDARTAAQLAGLGLSPERVETLRRTLAEFVDGFSHVWALGAGDRQPATLGFDDEDLGR